MLLPKYKKISLNTVFIYLYFVENLIYCYLYTIPNNLDILVLFTWYIIYVLFLDVYTVAGKSEMKIVFIQMDGEGLRSSLTPKQKHVLIRPC